MLVAGAGTCAGCCMLVVEADACAGGCCVLVAEADACAGCCVLIAGADACASFCCVLFKASTRHSCFHHVANSVYAYWLSFEPEVVIQSSVSFDTEVERT